MIEVTRLAVAYILYVDSQPQNPCESFQAATNAASTFLHTTAPLKIQTMAGPAPSRTWNYDYSVAQWIERL